MLYFSDSQSGVPKFQILVILKDKILISFLLGVQFSTIFGLRVREYLMVESHLCISSPFKYHFATLGSSNIINDLLSLLFASRKIKNKNSPFISFQSFIWILPDAVGSPVRMKAGSSLEMGPPDIWVELLEKKQKLILNQS
jgi:hypothetical protein